MSWPWSFRLMCGLYPLYFTTLKFIIIFVSWTRSPISLSLGYETHPRLPRAPSFFFHVLRFRVTLQESIQKRDYSRTTDLCNTFVILHFWKLSVIHQEVLGSFRCAVVNRVKVAWYSSRGMSGMKFLRELCSHSHDSLEESFRSE